MVLRLTKPYFNGSETEAVKEVLESGWLAEGKKTEEFEKVLCEVTESDYAVAVCNATVGLELCLRALDIKGCVATSAFGHPATVRAILNADCVPYFVDVNIETYNIEVTPELRLGSKRRKMAAYMPVSWGGNPNYIINFDGSPVIEDAACSLGAGDNYGRGTRVFSFHPRKLVTTGEGGAVTTNDEKLADSIRDLKNFGRGNYRFDDIRAAIGIEQLKKLNYLLKIRREMARIYDELLKDLPVVAPKTHYHNTHTYQTYAILLKRGNRNRIIDTLKAKGIESQIGAYALAPLKNAQTLADNLLSLPMSYTLSFSDQERVVDELKSAISKTSHS